MMHTIFSWSVLKTSLNESVKKSITCMKHTERINTNNKSFSLLICDVKVFCYLVRLITGDRNTKNVLTISTKTLSDSRFLLTLYMMSTFLVSCQTDKKFLETQTNSAHSEKTTFQNSL